MTSAPLPLLADDLASCCSPLAGGALDEDAAERLARVFRALGDRHRVRLLSLIAASEGGEACICDLTAPVGLSQPTISHHMKLLVEAVQALVDHCPALFDRQSGRRGRGRRRNRSLSDQRCGPGRILRDLRQTDADQALRFVVTARA